MSQFITDQITRKNQYNRAYFATGNTVKHTVTDMDCVPYIRFYRGQYLNPEPVIMDRAAGYRQVGRCLTNGATSWNTYSGDQRVQNVLETYNNEFPQQPSTVAGKSSLLDDNYLSNLCWETPCSTTFPCFAKKLPDYRFYKIASDPNPVNTSP